MENLFQDPAFLKSLLEVMADGLMVVDKQGTILFFNRAAEEMTGYAMREVIGQRCSVLNTDTCVIAAESSQGYHCKLFEKGCVSQRKCQITRKDGRAVHLLKNAVVLKDVDGEPLGAVEVMTDVTSLYMKQLEVEELRSELQLDYGFMGLIGMSAPMKKLYAQIQNAAKSEAPVMICGESGSGKELVAQAISRLSRRSKGAFIKVNCAALNEHLLESELFGHVKGAFTGAIKDRIGRFEAAHGGTIFLDEVGDMPASMQVKLLRVLQEKEVERVGEHNPRRVDVRLITATNRDICDLVDRGKLREDFFYRINVIPVQTPPLRQKREDIPALVSHFLKRIGRVNNRALERVSPAAMEALQSYHWPGNVRQLINVLEYAAITCRNEVDLSDLPAHLLRGGERRPPSRRIRDRDRILNALEKFQWNRTQAAKYLDISRVTLWKLMKEFSIKETVK